MAEIVEFPGVLYDPARAGDPAALFCPPYDVISPDEQVRYYELSPYNVIRIELGREEPGDDERANKYTRAAAHLEEWLAAGVFRVDAPSLYLYLQEFEWDGRRYSRPGIVGAVRLHEFSERVILPHEKTLSKPKADRYNLMRATRANVSQIFGFFSDTEGSARLAIEKARRTEPIYSFTDDAGVTHALYRFPANAVPLVKSAIAAERLFIADGHHRYETALRYREAMRAERGDDPAAPWNYVMMTVVPVEADLLVLPIHRTVTLPEPLADREILARLAPYFDVSVSCGPLHLRDALAKADARAHAFGMVTNSGEYLVTLKPGLEAEAPGEGSPALRSLDARLLEHFGFASAFGIPRDELESRLSFTSDYDVAVARAKASPERVSFLLRPISVETIKEVALALETMPQKTTFFYPKVWTGLVLRLLDR